MDFPMQAASLDLSSPSSMSLSQVIKKKKCKKHLKDETPPVFFPELVLIAFDQKAHLGMKLGAQSTPSSKISAQSGPATGQGDTRSLVTPRPANISAPTQIQPLFQSCYVYAVHQLRLHFPVTMAGGTRGAAFSAK